jgi:hypothetical protein
MMERRLLNFLAIMLLVATYINAQPLTDSARRKARESFYGCRDESQSHTSPNSSTSDEEELLGGQTPITTWTRVRPIHGIGGNLDLARPQIKTTGRRKRTWSSHYQTPNPGPSILIPPEGQV